MGKMPHSPEPQTGRTQPLNINHGEVVFVTGGELDWANFVLSKVFLVGIGSFGVLFLIRVYWK